jgi:hypothetical protein
MKGETAVSMKGPFTKTPLPSNQVLRLVFPLPFESALRGQLPMTKSILTVVAMTMLLCTLTTPATAQDNVDEFLKEFPNQEQVRMMNAWLEKHEKGTFSFTGLVDPTDTTVVTPQATVDYGYSWFSISDGPATVRTPQYNKFFSVSFFDMKHNIPAVVVNPERPILLVRPGQPIPEGDYHIVEMETDQGLVLTRMVVVDNMEEVRKLSKSIVMEGGKGDMARDVQRFSEETIKAGNAVMKAYVPFLNPDAAFPHKSGEVGPITLATAVLIGQLGTPSESVRYAVILGEEDGTPFNGTATYELIVPAAIVHEEGYMSVTVYGADNKLLIPNDKKIYDRTSYSSKQNKDGTYTITLSPDGEGLNGIPTGKPFYAILRAYVPVEGADLTLKVNKK